MPPINQQGSRTGLIVTMVLSIVVAVVFIITTVYFNSQFQQDEKKLVELRQKYAGVVSDEKLLGAEGAYSPAQVDSMRKELAVAGNVPLTDLLQTQTEKVTAAIGGVQEPYTTALQKLADAQADAAKRAAGAGVKTGEPVTASLKKLADAVGAQKQSAAAATSERDKSKAELAAALAGLKAQVEKLDEDAKSAAARADKAEQDKAAAETKYVEAQGKADESSKKAVEDAAKQVQEAITAKQTAEAVRDKAIKDRDAARTKLASIRYDTKNHMIAYATDGEIARLGNGNVVYINLGSADHLPPGLVFEVYDKATGVPNSKTDQISDTNLPVGKASIEVVRIGQNSSECRIVHTAPGQTVGQGDIVVNLVYDRNTSYHFFVYGEFDVDQNKVYSAQEADVIKSLITRWGGTVDDKITIDTDFIILGREPKIPQLTQDEIQNDPLLLAKKNAAEAALKAYQDIINRSAEFYIPIMNQNRFLYYVGYFDQAKR